MGGVPEVEFDAVLWNAGGAPRRRVDNGAVDNGSSTEDGEDGGEEVVWSIDAEEAAEGAAGGRDALMVRHSRSRSRSRSRCRL